MKKILLLALICMLDNIAFGQTWKLNKTHASFMFSISHFIVSNVDGTFKEFDATINSSKPDFSDARFDFTANTASVNTEDENRDEHLRNADFFNSQKYPTIKFVSTSIKPAAKNHYSITGNLTLGSVTKPLTVDLWNRGAGNGAEADLEVNGSIKRSDFNFGSGFGVATLGDEVKFKARGGFDKTN